MANKLAFTIPFSGFTFPTFINCFASTYMFLEGIAVDGKADYDCRQLRGLPCNSCGNCAAGGDTPLTLQERYYFLFDTMCGRSSLRYRYDGTPTAMQRLVCDFGNDDGGTEDNIDFLLGFAGYAYRREADPAAFRHAIAASIAAGRPVIGRVKAGEGRFRVIIGYDGDALIDPDYTNAQKKPEGPTALGELEALYLIGNKEAPRYTLRDGIARICRVMQYNHDENLWGEYINKLGTYSPGGTLGADAQEKKARMQRVAETMWYTFNCHNFAEVFRRLRAGQPVGEGLLAMEALRGGEFDAMWDQVGGPCYGYTHDLAWGLIGLEECADWTKHAAGYFGEMTALVLTQIAKNDEQVLEIMQKALTRIR